MEKPSRHAFLFSVNEGRKYLITGGDKSAISCNSDFCALFGTEGNELVIWSDSNCNTDSYCIAGCSSYNLPASKGKEGPSMNGGEEDFKLKQFEVYSVMVRMKIDIRYRNNERWEG